jgi:HAD superfamily hydrolase (TIGR01509 family)
MPAGPRALIFDCDGVIADDEPLHLLAFQRALAPEGITITRETYYARYLGLNDREAVRQVFRDADVLPAGERMRAVLAAKAEHFLALVRSGAPILPGVVPFARAAAARVPLAVASGALRHELDLLLDQAGITDCFTAIVSAEDVREGKPSPEGFLLAHDRLRAHSPDLQPHDCLVIEDSPPGIEAAQRAHMRCLALTNSYPPTALAGADLIVHSLEAVSWDRLAALW